MFWKCQARNVGEVGSDPRGLLRNQTNHIGRMDNLEQVTTFVEPRKRGSLLEKISTKLMHCNIVSAGRLTWRPHVVPLSNAQLRTILEFCTTGIHCR